MREVRCNAAVNVRDTAVLKRMATSRVAMKVKKRNDLNLQLKVSAIKAYEKEPQPSGRQMAEKFNCGKTQISTILQNKAEILDMYESISSGKVI